MHVSNKNSSGRVKIACLMSIVILTMFISFIVECPLSPASNVVANNSYYMIALK